MITCPYCDTNYEIFQPKCSSCGANLPNRLANIKQPKQKPIDQKSLIRIICEKYEDAKEFRPLDGLPIYVLENAKYSYLSFPEKMQILLICDTTITMNGKKGFIIATDGLYWRNSWTTDSNRNKLSWDDFAKRDLALNRFTLELGRGDAIGLSGLGSDAKRAKALNLLTEIKQALQTS